MVKCILIVFFLTCSTFAADHNDIVSMNIEEERYVTMSLQKLWEEGSAYCLFCVGKKYDCGLGVERDLEKAFYAYTLSADKGFVPAKNNLGTMYMDGRGTPHNYQEALRLFEEAESRGSASAAHNLAVMYYYGKGVGRDYIKAAKLFHIAANGGRVPAYSALGSMYYYGNGVIKCNAKAIKWFQKAAEEGVDEAKHSLSLLVTLNRSVMLLNYKDFEASDEIRNTLLYLTGEFGLRLAMNKQKVSFLKDSFYASSALSKKYDSVFSSLELVRFLLCGKLEDNKSYFNEPGFMVKCLAFPVGEEGYSERWVGKHWATNSYTPFVVISQIKGKKYASMGEENVKKMLALKEVLDYLRNPTELKELIEIQEAVELTYLADIRRIQLDARLEAIEGKVDKESVQKQILALENKINKSKEEGAFLVQTKQQMPELADYIEKALEENALSRSSRFIDVYGDCWPKFAHQN